MIRDIIDSIINNIPPIHKEGHVFIFIFILIAIFAFSVSKSFGWIALFLTICCVAFFRDPHRFTPVDPNLIISPADGRVDKIAKVPPPPELEGMGLGEQMNRVSIFLSVADVHVNRIPISGIIKKLHYNPGTFFNASLDKASKFNERQTVLIETENQNNIIVTQIAGLIARRIVCHLDENQHVKSGERFGIIRFGSRVDIYLPEEFTPLVSEGQYMIGGETVIADLKGDQKSLPRERR